MAHKFYKTSSNTSGIPSRVDDKVWDKLKKFAHDVWQVNSGEEAPIVNRVRAETVEPGAGDSHSSAHPELYGDSQDQNTISAGDLVLMFIGGQKISAQVVHDHGDVVTVATADGYMDVPPEMVRKAQKFKSVGQVTTRTITRNDVPAQTQPAPQAPLQMDPGMQRSVLSINKFLDKSGGSALISLGSGANGQPNNAEITRGPDGSITVAMIQMTPQVYHRGSYASVEQFVKDMNIEGGGNLALLGPGKGQ